MGLKILGEQKEFPENSKEKTKTLRDIIINEKERFYNARIANDLTTTMFNKMARSLFTRFLENEYYNGDFFPSCTKTEYTYILAIEILCPKFDLEEVLQVWFWKNPHTISCSKRGIYFYSCNADDFRYFKNSVKFSRCRSLYRTQKKNYSKLENYERRGLDESIISTRIVIKNIMNDCSFLKKSFKIRIG